MKILKITLISVFAFGLMTSCFEDQDDNAIASSDISDFVWKAMNAVYLYKSEIPDLADNRFSSNEEYNAYLNGFSGPEELFESLIYERETVDRFSIIVNDYIALEQALNGVFKSNGLEYNFYYIPGSSTEAFGIIRLVLNNSVASGLNLERGQVFTSVNGTPLTASNLNSLLGQDTYTLEFADYDDNGTPETSDDTITPNGESITLTKQPYTENPVHLASIIPVDGVNVGYLMYNAFNANFVNQLNQAFATFQSNNVQDVVLDLRYNGGGRVDVAAFLGSMITGQFNGDVFSKLIYNENLQSNNDTYNFSSTLGSGGAAINSLNLNRVYVLTTDKTASASEMIINSLKEYIQVIQIGGTTVGKSQASITVYDSPDLSRDNVNPNHTYALQPLVAISVNANDGQVPPTGIEPETTFEVIESPRNFGVLGDVNEPLLARAIQHISGNGRVGLQIGPSLNEIKGKLDLQPLENEMYIDPEILFKN
ncbi:S41 family peptidase [Subsaxibacter sp. CAU 1640]|uniref:S41 family peptidase n=1 Tax=Subsaxibacter sp. CAU 1640 TaxID=2933271 RepID=UPI0020051C39|nr:S41 family peptidase [Subsaxibacter sp. CAU 1640]MCK7589932.1 S41 family peptidase [Subsaxibacter sp. CAU 1640]